jgi:hypothetical protein
MLASRLTLTARMSFPLCIQALGHPKAFNLDQPLFPYTFMALENH